MIRPICWTMLLLLTAACATEHHNPGPAEPTDSARERMSRGIKDMERGDYSAAIEEFDGLLVQKPASQFDLLALFNDGAAHVEIDDCKKGSQLFRQAVQGAAAMKAARIQAESLYQLSLAYECMGDDRKAISAMLDARKRSVDLTPEVGKAELPARLAAAYARIGQRAKALQYFHEASSGLKLALSESGTTSRIQTQFAARTLYAMGQLTPRQKGLSGDAKSYLTSLSMQQPYLLQSAEMAVPPDSRKAADELIYAYENMLKMKPNDPTEVRPFLELALQNIAEIKKIRLPGKGALVDEIFDKIEVQESRVRQMLMALSETTPLTDEARKRQGIKRQGRTVGQPTVLEKQNSQ